MATGGMQTAVWRKGIRRKGGACAKAGLPRRLFRRENGPFFVLAGILLLSFCINFFAIEKVGYGNAYYAAAVKSMTESFRNFFFVSFDSAGTVSVDKPPLALWIQVLFVWIFGYHGWAMLLPQALAGTASCWMMYVLTARYFGRPAGLTAALVFALTPAVAVAARNNTMDMQLVLALLAATWFLFRAVERGKWRYLFLCAVFIGVGFNIKMLQAYMILPAVALIYLLFAKEKVLLRILAGAISLLIVAAVSFAWVFAVDLTPASARPYVGSSTDNSELELVIGHNGVQRLMGATAGNGAGNRRGAGGGNGPGGFGNRAGGGNRSANGGWAQGGAAQNGNAAQNGAGTTQNGNTARNGGQAGGRQGFSGGGSGNAGPGSFGQSRSGSSGINGNDIGSAGWLRLWEQSLYGQASWLIVFALFGFAAALRKKWFRTRSPRLAVACYWLVWLVGTAVFFSFAGFWHRYYLCMLAPGIAGLCGIGLTQMARGVRTRSWRRFLLPAAFAATLGVELVYVWKYPQERVWLLPVMLASAAVSAAAAGIARRRPKRLRISRKAAAAFSGALLLVSLLAAPFYWSLTTVLFVSSNITMPYAGPELATSGTVITSTPNQEAYVKSDAGMSGLEKYLVAHYRKGTYLAVSLRANDVAQFIIDTGLPCAAYGGFQGTDDVWTLDAFKALVKAGKIRYVFVSDEGGMGQNEIQSYVESNAKLVNASEYGDASQKVGQVGGKLYQFAN